MIFNFIRRNLSCRFGNHWRVVYDSGIPNDICRPGICTDCGERIAGIEWSLPPSGIKDQRSIVAGGYGTTWQTIEYEGYASKGYTQAMNGLGDKMFGPTKMAEADTPPGYKKMVFHEDKSGEVGWYV